MHTTMSSVNPFPTVKRKTFARRSAAFQATGFWSDTSEAVFYVRGAVLCQAPGNDSTQLRGLAEQLHTPPAKGAPRGEILASVEDGAVAPGAPKAVVRAHSPYVDLDFHLVQAAP